ncbi:hypothetical protein MKW98_020426 [Papaver atlanticum]|uniref:Uncharacterized protein n=1 Tax=Papaver atlanticum TaxID=357466 RepID=A0AAD4RVK3_9MAGN|nr:hypothetical protein MKW98_020426 [Papaver atlanticum]
MVAGLELLVSPVIESLISNLASTAFDGNNLFSDAKFELEKFYKTLTNIQAVLCDAEKMQVENMLVQNWLRELKDVAYWAEEVVGEFQYEALRRRMKIHGRMGKKIKNFFSLSNPVGFRLKMARKVKGINRMLDGITKGMESFKFVNLCGTSNGATSCKVSIERETSSHVNDFEAVLGRELDKSKVIGLLIDNSDSNQKIHYSVVRIVGMGGIGKTTLAQLVYADESVKEQFQIKMWVCLSIKSNTKEIFTDLLESSSGGVSSMDAIKNRLIERLKGKKYLIVLDDVWIDNKIDVEKLLKDLLSMGSEGSKILMTMRSDEDIPPKMGCRYTQCGLEGLLEEDCWSLFENIAFGPGGAKKTPNLVDIGLKIVKKCGGLPLAAKTLGGLLRSRSDELEWSYILNSQIWNLPQSEDKIIRVIKLSYDRLSPSLKQCFSYCSIFPKNYNISKKKLIRLWMAEGFLISPSGESEVLEAVGDNYFKILLLNYFIQDEKRNQRGDIKSFKMHDLVHDLALSVVGTESSLVAVDSNGLKCTEDTNRLRRVGLVLDLDISTTPLPIYKANKLRTLVSFPSSHASKINGSVWGSMVSNWILLRVLDLREAAIQELPASICKMKHLRYLDLSSTYLEFFPSSFTKLYNLHTLRVKDCIRLTELPKDIRHLINMKYLIFSDGHQVTQMPRGLRKLSQLQELSTFVVGKGKGCGIEELKDLNFLRGKLTVSRLENVRNSIGANLKEKKDIRYLALHWGGADDHNSVSEDTREYEMVFDGLQPHPYLKELVIKNFSGFKFPTWLGSTSIYLPNLVSVTLEKCDKCEHLPGLGRLQFLKFFTIERMVSLRRIGSEFYGSNEGAAVTNTSFPSLIKLSFQCMDNLEEWLGDQSSSLVSSFPCLEELKIQGRSMLRIMPTLFPSLRLLDCAGISGMTLVSLVANNLTSLTDIYICNCTHPTLLPQVLFRGNSVLRTLTVSCCPKFEGFCSDDAQEEKDLQLHHNLSKSSLYRLKFEVCPSLTSLPDLQGLNSLTSLVITVCKSLKSLPDGIQYLPALEELKITGMSDDLESFPFPPLKADASPDEKYFISLRKLHINGWPNLKSDLPEQLQYLTSLRDLYIGMFPLLETLPEWFGNLSSLKELSLYDCEQLKYLPSKEQMLRLTSLKELTLQGCRLLEVRCEPGNDESHKISHLGSAVSFAL